MEDKVYQKMYKESIINSEEFWREQAYKEIHWIQPFKQVFDGTKWFEGGKLNVCYNCVDRHPADKVAFTSLEGTKVVNLTYGQLLIKIYEFCNYFDSIGLEKGDCITFYLKNSAESYACILACARLGIVVNCVFGGFSETILEDRVQQTGSKMLITNDFIERSGSSIDLLCRAKAAASGLTILVLDSTSRNANSGNVIYWNNCSKSQNYVPYKAIESNDHLFYIFTSGSTGKAKQVIHGTAGYLMQTIMSTKYCLQVSSNDTFFSTADVGWIACLSYTLFGPLSIGATAVIYDCQPFFPNNGRLFEYFNLLGVTHFNTAPTLIRMMKSKIGEDIDDSAKNIKFMSFVGEPLDSESREYLRDMFPNAHINNNYWQTETGGIMLFDCIDLQGVPTFGVAPKILKYNENGVIGDLLFNKSWPSQAIEIRDDKTDIKPSKYLNVFEGYYYSADEAILSQGSIFVKGRVDDVFNICGHRVGSCEIENSVAKLPFINESAAISQNDEIMGSVVCIVVSCKNKDPENAEKIKRHVVKDMGKFVRVGNVYFVDELPKTRTGKIMRKLMSEMLNNNRNLKNIDSCSNPECLDNLFSCKR